MVEVLQMSRSLWDEPGSPQDIEANVRALESGKVLAFPHMPFEVSEGERNVLGSTTLGHSKNISYQASNRQLKGCEASPEVLQQVAALMQRFADASQKLLETVLSPYSGGLQRARTSLRPQEIAGRQTSWRKDDTRLHVDAFPSSPTQGKRILRVFSNINPSGKPRVWRLGGDFEEIAARYPLTPPAPGSSRLLQWLHITKSRRTEYDHHMLALHDKLKADTDYQTGDSQGTYEFAAGTTWIVFTDQVPHAAMSGQFALEQSFLLPVSSMQESARSPLRILERLQGRAML